MNTPTDPLLQRYLHGLPPAEPEADLRARVLQANARRRARRRWALPLAMAAAGALVMVAWTGLAPPEPTAAAPDAVASAELRALDRRLQAAYLAPAAEAERELLWQARGVAESHLASGAQAPRLVQL